MNECIFCKIINGQIPATKVYEDDTVIAFNDINPQAPVHIIVIPKLHIESHNEISSDNISIIGNMHLAINKITTELGIDKTGYKVLNNCGKDGGQEVMHLHFHILGGAKI